MVSDEFHTPYAAANPLGLEKRASMKFRTFRTRKDGKIVLPSDLEALFDKIPALGEVIVQSRHQYARLVTMRRAPSISRDRTEGGFRDVEGLLRMTPSGPWTGLAKLEHCRCCGSPGRIELHNRHGMEFFHISAPPECNVAAWSEFLEKVVASAGASVATGDAGTPASGPFREFPRLGHSEAILTDDAALLATLLSTAGDAGITFLWTLATPDIRHSGEFCPANLEISGSILTAGGEGSAFQVAMPFVRGLALDPTESRLELKVFGPDHTVLGALAPVSSGSDSAVWHEILRDTFPILD